MDIIGDPYDPSSLHYHAAAEALNFADSSTSCSALVTFVALVVNTINARIERQRQAEARKHVPDVIYTDLLIIGGGTGGTVLASRLSEDPELEVLLVERGGPPQPESSIAAFADILYQSDVTENVMAIPEANNCNGTGCLLRFARMLGGGMAINDMVWCLGNLAYDFRRWADQTNDEFWKPSEVLEVFKKIERNLDPDIAQNTAFHGTRGPQPVRRVSYLPEVVAELVDAWQELGYPYTDINTFEQIGVTVMQSPYDKGQRVISARSYLGRTVRSRPNLTIQLFTEVQRILFNKTSTPVQAIGAEMLTAAGRTVTVFAKRGVVLAAGAVGSAKLIMLSGIGPKDDLIASKIDVILDLPVGRRFADQVLYQNLLFTCPTCSSTWGDYKEALRQYEASQTGPLAGIGPSPALAMINYQVDNHLPANVANFEMVYDATYVDPNGNFCQAADRVLFNTIYAVPMALHLRTTGTVRLNQRDKNGHPEIQLNFLSDARDIREGVEAYKLQVAVAERLQRAGSPWRLDTNKQQGCTQHEFASDEYFSCLLTVFSGTAFHYSSSLPMGTAEDPTAVTDSRGRVFHTTGLYVSDASLMPSLISGNTMYTVMMIAEKIAEVIKRDIADQRRVEGLTGLSLPQA